ncbi:hypothetical protein Tco_1210794 [Tanacetum coccineum]
MGLLPRSSPWKGVLGKGTLSPLSFFLLLLKPSYANDALIFEKWSDLSAKNLLHILMCYEDALGLKVNLAKSRLFGIGVPQNEVLKASWSVPPRGMTLDDLFNLITLIGNVSLFGDADDK